MFDLRFLVAGVGRW